MKLFLMLYCLFISVTAQAQTDWFYGAWDYQECDAKNTICMVVDYTFNKNGTVHVDAYPPLRQRATFKIVSADSGKAVLKLANSTGEWGKWKEQLVLEYNAANNTIKIDGQGPYTKLKPVKTNHREPNEQ